MSGPLLCPLRGLRVVGCWRVRAGQQVNWGDFAGGQGLDLKRLRQADAAGAVEPVIDLALADRGPHPLAESGLRDAVLLEVVSESHNHIMVYFNVC